MAFGEIGLALNFATAGLNAIRGGPKLPLTIDDINNMFDMEISKSRNRISGDVSRRLASQGLGGSGVINQIIEDLSGRESARINEARRGALKDFQMLKFQADRDAFDRLSGTLQSLGNLGGNAFFLDKFAKNPFGNNLTSPGDIGFNGNFNLGGNQGFSIDSLDSLNNITTS